MTRWFLDRSPQRGIPSVSLRRLLPDARFVGCQDWEVSGCTADSRKLNPGQVFIAVRGEKVDGHTFVARALDQGAAGVVVEEACPEAGRLQVVVADSRSAYARISHALAGDPAGKVRVAGVTGRRGKSATALFLHSILQASGESVGSIGRSGWSDGVSKRPTGPGSPGPEGFASMLAAIADRRGDSAVVELEDRAIDLREVDGVAFDSAVITSLGGPGATVQGPDRDSLIARRRSYARLARLVVAGGSVVIDADDPDADVLGSVNLEARRVTYGRNRPANVSAIVERVDGAGSRLRLRGFDREAVVELRIAGEEFIGHALAASAVAWSRGVDARSVLEGLESVTRLPGRLEPVVQGQDFEVRIDRARTAPDLARALASVRALGAGRVICVVGAEGGRDQLRRAAIGRAAEQGSDQVILTTNDPRGEDPDQILDDLLAGFRHPGRVQVEPDRRAAIARALSEAHPGDAVLIAGKGHHGYQILADRVLPFDDAEVAADWLRAHRGEVRSASA